MTRTELERKPKTKRDPIDVKYRHWGTFWVFVATVLFSWVCWMHGPQPITYDFMAAPESYPDFLKDSLWANTLAMLAYGWLALQVFFVTVDSELFETKKLKFTVKGVAQYFLFMSSLTGFLITAELGVYAGFVGGFVVMGPILAILLPIVGLVFGTFIIQTFIYDYHERNQLFKQLTPFARNWIAEPIKWLAEYLIVIPAKTLFAAVVAVVKFVVVKPYKAWLRYMNAEKYAQREGV